MLIMLFSNARRRRWAKGLRAPSYWSTVRGRSPPSWLADLLDRLSLGIKRLLPKLQLEIIKGKKGQSKKRLETVLSYQKRLVEEKGVPPSRLMQEQAAAAHPSPPTAESVASEEPSPWWKFLASVNCVIMNPHQNMAWVFTGDAQIKKLRSLNSCLINHASVRQT